MKHSQWNKSLYLLWPTTLLYKTYLTHSNFFKNMKHTFTSRKAARCYIHMVSWILHSPSAKSKWLNSWYWIIECHWFVLKLLPSNWFVLHNYSIQFCRRSIDHLCQLPSSWVEWDSHTEFLQWAAFSSVHWLNCQKVGPSIVNSLCQNSLHRL